MSVPDVADILRRNLPGADGGAELSGLVAELLCHDGDVIDAVIIVAALLHDTTGDTRTTKTQLRRQFARVVVEVTNNKGLPKQRRKEVERLEQCPRLAAVRLPIV